MRGGACLAVSGTGVGKAGARLAVSGTGVGKAHTGSGPACPLAGAGTAEGLWEEEAVEVVVVSAIIVNNR